MNLRSVSILVPADLKADAGGQKNPIRLKCKRFLRYRYRPVAKDYPMVPLRYGYGKSSGLTEEVQLLYHCSDCIFWLLRVAYMGLRAQMAGIDATVTVAGRFTIHSKTCLV